MFSDGRHHVAGRQVLGRDLVWVQPDAHGIIPGAEDLHVASAGNPRQDVFHLERGVITQVDLIITALRREQVHDHGEVGRLFERGYPEAPHTSSGSLGNAWETRFWTCTCALSTSVPSLNVTVSVMTPSEVA